MLKKRPPASNEDRTCPLNVGCLAGFDMVRSPSLSCMPCCSPCCSTVSSANCSSIRFVFDVSAPKPLAFCVTFTKTKQRFVPCQFSIQRFVDVRFSSRYLSAKRCAKGVKIMSNCQLVGYCMCINASSYLMTLLKSYPTKAFSSCICPRFPSQAAKSLSRITQY